MLSQEFPRHLALLRLDDVRPDLTSPEALAAYEAAFEALRADPLAPHRVLLAGGDERGLRLLMALMRLAVLRLRDLNFERFEAHGGSARLLSAYVRGENLPLPLPDRAAVLFIERADLAPAAGAAEIEAWNRPLFATWEGPAGGPLWEALSRGAAVIRL